MDTTLIRKISEGEKDLAKGFYFSGFFAISMTLFLNYGLKYNVLHKFYFPAVAIGGSYLAGHYVNELFRNKSLAAFEKVDEHNVLSAGYYYNAIEERKDK